MGYGVAARGVASEMMSTIGNSGAAILSKIDEFICQTAIRKAIFLFMVIGVGSALPRLCYILINQKLLQLQNQRLKKIEEWLRGDDWVQGDPIKKKKCV